MLPFSLALPNPADMRARGTLFVLLLAVAIAPCARAQQVAFGSAASVNNFHGLTYHHASLLFPLSPSAAAGWRPDAWAAGIGAFRRDGDDATVYTFGPVWRLDDPLARCRCFIDAGISLAYLGQRAFFDRVKQRDEDFGSDLEFMSRASLGWYIDARRQWSMKLNVLHVSNGGLSDVNPGVDLVGINIEAEF